MEGLRWLLRAKIGGEREREKEGTIIKKREAGEGELKFHNDN